MDSTTCLCGETVNARRLKSGFSSEIVGSNPTTDTMIKHLLTNAVTNALRVCGETNGQSNAWVSDYSVSGTGTDYRNPMVITIQIVVEKEGCDVLLSTLPDSVSQG